MELGFHISGKGTREEQMGRWEDHFGIYPAPSIASEGSSIGPWCICNLHFALNFIVLDYAD